MYIFILTVITIFTSLIIVDGLYKIKETFKSDYSDYKQIDRIHVDDNFAYCINS